MIVQSTGEGPGRAADQVSLVVRADDAGMSHSVNMALERLIATGLPLSVSVMFACPWYQEAVEILKRHPDVAVGIHLTLNSEWKNYRWGPVSGRGVVPTLVDSEGYFFASTQAFIANKPDAGEVERELRAQIDRALRSGLKIDYVDYHMGTPVATIELGGITKRLAREFGFGMSGYIGETMTSPQYFAAPDRKLDSVVTMLGRLRPGLTVVVTHVGLDDAELGALVDMNSGNPLSDMSRNRQGELDAFTSRRFRDAVGANNVRLMTYRQAIELHGLRTMRGPTG